MKRILTLLLNFILVAGLLAPVSAIAAPPPPTPPDPIEPIQRQAIEQAVQKAVQAEQPGSLYFMIYDIKVDRIELNADQTTGLAWLVPVDPKDGSIIATEPAVAVIKLPAQNAEWQVTLPTNSNYQSVLAALPPGLLSQELSDSILTPASVTPQSTQVFTGYFLPWEGGKGKYLSGSIGHFLIYHSCSEAACRYAYDFYDGTHFPLRASKGGIVWSYYDAVANDVHTNVNYLVLRDPTTSPVTYQLYYHLAQGSIPAGLKRVGAVVTQGDFIGNADNTGYSSGSHLHFMVYADPTIPGSSWGNSVDIVFSDVQVNGGRPRTYIEATTYPGYGTQYNPNDFYVSGNRGATPPTGVLTAPAAWTEVTGPTISVSGQGYDNISVSGLQVAADYDGTWKVLSPQFTTNPFTVNVNLCSAGVPDGPLTIGLWVWDNEGTRTLLAQSPRPIIKNYSCQAPPPPCNPGLGEIALYTLPDYMGLCQVYSAAGGINSAGIYDTASLGGIADNSATSIKVGGSVMATLYDGNYSGGAFSGRAESFDSSDPGLADNRTGASHVSSLRVLPLAVPAAPVLDPAQSVSGANPKSTDSVMLSWSGAGGGVDFQAELTLPGGGKRTSPWLRAASWSLGSLAAGNYSWKVTARNASGSTPSNPANFSVSQASLSGSPASFPYGDNMSSGVNGWTASGFWRQTNSSADANNKFWAANKSSAGPNPRDGSYASTTAPSELTSPPIAIPSSGSAFLRFHEFFQTESSWPYWDQRLVQISVDGGPFNDVYQMLDDPQDAWPSNYWIFSPFINLSAYAGKTVRVRFYFNPIDATDNNFLGWFIDDVSLNDSAPDLTKAEPTSNNSPATATPIAMNSTTPINYVCPVDDADYYSVSVNAGDIVNFNIDAKSAGLTVGTQSTTLDTYIYLIDSDGKSVLAENDDEVYWVVTDSNLTYQFRRGGTYYLKVKRWSYPGSTLAVYNCDVSFYALKVYGSNFPPTIHLTTPANPFVGNGPLDVSANVTLSASGLSAVTFLWHSPDWSGATWETLPAPTSPSPGVWKSSLDPSGRAIDGSVLVGRVTDNAGLTSTTWLPNLQTDVESPVTHLTAPTGTVQSTVFLLTWTAADSKSGVKYTEIEYKDLTQATGWQAWPITFGSQVRQAYFTGQAGHSYGFSVHGVDNAGNVEGYTTDPEITVNVAATCTPDAFDLTPPGDNSPATASQLAMGVLQVHNFCTAGDEDWLNFTAPSAGKYLVRVRSLGSGSDVNAALTSPDGLHVLALATPPAFGQGVDLRFTVTAAGSYKLHLTAPNANLWGTDMQYSVIVSKGNWQYLPKIGK